MISLKDKIEQVKENIAEACNKSKRDMAEITTVVVTKTTTVENIIEAIKLGCTDFGENRVQQLKEVAEQIDKIVSNQMLLSGKTQNINWHLIGHLQRNKVKQVLPIVKMIQSVDTLRLAEEISQQSKKAGITTKILLQVNCSGEPQKFGIPVGAATHLAEQFSTMPNIELAGIMTMAPLTKDENIIRRCFVRAREIFEDIKNERFASKEFHHISMGMSNDYKIAVEEGATILRIGSAIFA